MRRVWVTREIGEPVPAAGGFDDGFVGSGELGEVPLDPERRVRDALLIDDRATVVIRCDEAIALVLVDTGIEHGGALLERRFGLHLSNAMLLLEGTSWKHQAHEAGGACFQRKVVVFVRKMSLVKDVPSLARRLVAPQLMGRAVL